MAVGASLWQREADYKHKVVRQFCIAQLAPAMMPCVLTTGYHRPGLDLCLGAKLPTVAARS